MGLVIYGTERIPGVTHIDVTHRQQQSPPVRTAPETTRNDRQGVRQLKLASLDQGLGVRRGSEASKDIQRTRYNDGPWQHIFGNLTLPPVSTAQTISSFTTSGSRAANLRIHQVNSTIGQSKPRPYFFHKTKMFRTVSDSNPALEDSTLALTNNVTGAFECKLNGTRGILVLTDGDTDDAQFITDPTTTPPTRSTAFAYTSGDWVGGGFYLPNLGPGCVILYGKIGGVTGLFWLPTDEALLTAPKQLILASTKDIPNPDNAIQDTGFKFASRGFEAFNEGGTAWGSSKWSNVNNITANDNTYATTPDAEGSTNAAQLCGLFTDFAIPIAATSTGRTFRYRRFEGDASLNAITKSIRLFRGVGAVFDGSDIPQFTIDLEGVDPADMDTAEWATSEEAIEDGGSTDRWGVDFTPAQINAGIGVALQMDQASVAFHASVDSMELKEHYRPFGVQASIPLGGDVVGIDPLDAMAGYIRAPEFQDETGAINVPRILWKLTFEFNSDHQAPLVELTKVSTLLSYVEGACFAQGGICATGDNSSGLGKAIKRIEGTENFDLGFGAGQGYTENWGVVNLHGADRALVADVALEDASIAQGWIGVDGRWSPLQSRQSISAMPIAYAEAATVDPTQRYRYRFVPSGSDTVVLRQYQPRNLLLDPLVHNTAVVKQDGVLVAQTPELDALGPEEAIKCLLNAWFLGRDVSSTNTVRLRYSTDGGSSFTTWTTFTSFASKSTLSTPVLFRTLILEIGLDHTAGSAATPNGLPLLVEGVAVWQSLRRWRVFINPEEPAFKEKYRGAGGIEKLWSNLAAIEALSPVNTFKPGNGVSEPAVWAGMNSAYDAQPDPTTGRGNTAASPDGHYIDFEEVTQ